MNIYYYANQVYQLSFAKLVYKELGGVFVVSRLNRKLRLIWYLRASQRNNTINKIFNKIPDILVINPVCNKPSFFPQVQTSDENPLLGIYYKRQLGRW